MRFIVMVLAWLTIGLSAWAGDLHIATFNTESDDDTQPAKVAETIKAMGRFDILAVQEVESIDALRQFADAASQQGGRWRFVVSESGVNSDRQADLLGIIYNIEKFRQLETSELHIIRSKPDGSDYGKADWSLRGALNLRLLDLESSQEFRVTTVHLKCCNEPRTRNHQAALLAQELRKADIPTIVLGDTNIPIEPGQVGPDSDNRPAFDALGTSSGRKWLAPSNAVKTQCSPDFNSMLDQIYVPSNSAATATSEVLFPQAEYCDSDELGFSDHRPLRALLPRFTDRDVAVVPKSLPVESKTVLTEEQLEARESELQQKGRIDDLGVGPFQ
jgi:endonuclease/exonuclease/phosphatase family metal-dependent hydrolase